MYIDTLSSVKNPRIKELVTLQERSRERRESGLFVVEGIRELEACIKGGFVIETLFFQPEIFPLDRAKDTGCQQLNEVTADLYSKIAYRDSTEGVIAIVREKQKLSFDRFILLKGWSEGISLICFAFSYGILSTYLAIYGKEVLGILGGTGLFFMILSIGLMLSRLLGSRSLRQGRITQNVSIGILISLCGYLLFAAIHTSWAYYISALVIGLGNGHMFPAFQNMFINLAPHTQRGTANSTLLTSWDVGIGIGILAGGALAETFGYSAAFWWAWIINAVGVVFYFAFVRKNYLKNKLR